MQIRVADYIADFFVSHGVEHNFTVTGGGAMHLNDALGHKEGLTCIYNHHEQACAIAAEAYARLTGKIALVCVTSGPGGTNTITGVIGGWLDSVPMFVLSGQVKRETTLKAVPGLPLRQLGDQEFDIVGSVSNMTKYAVMVTEPNDIAYHLEKAWSLCLSGRGGPVWLDIPLDVQGAKIETENLRHFDESEHAESPSAENSADACASTPAAAAPAVSNSLADEILGKIREAKAPLLLAGTGVRLGGAQEELEALIKKLDIPVLTAWNACDTVAYDDPHFAGMPGTVGTRPGNFAVQSCDLLLSLGCRLNIRMISYNKLDFAKNAYKIIVDIDEAELKKPTVIADMPVCSDVKEFINALLRRPYVPEPAHGRWRDWCHVLVEKYPAALPEYFGRPGLVNPYVFLDKLFGQLSAEDTIACGNGSACVMTFQAAKIKRGQRMFTNSGCAAMGYGLPAALGQAVATKGRRVICIDGDGSIMMNIQELATISYHRMNMKIILLNNNGYHSIRQTQTNLFKPPLVGVAPDSGVAFPDFGKLAEAFGLTYFRIETEAETDGILREALAAEGPVLCEAVVDPGQNFVPKLSSKVLPDGKIVSAELDDMFPFLPRGEYEANHYPLSEKSVGKGEAGL